MSDMTAEAVHGHGWRADDSQFGARLALVRQRMGWGNVKEAAVACGLPTESWRSWERDGRQPRNYVAVCAQISERTGCDLFWLLGVSTPEATGAAMNFRWSSPLAADSDDSDTLGESSSTRSVGVDRSALAYSA